MKKIRLRKFGLKDTKWEIGLSIGLLQHPRLRYPLSKMFKRRR